MLDISFPFLCATLWSTEWNYKPFRDSSEAALPVLIVAFILVSPYSIGGQNLFPRCALLEFKERQFKYTFICKITQIDHSHFSHCVRAIELPQNALLAGQVLCEGIPLIKTGLNGDHWSVDRNYPIERRSNGRFGLKIYLYV